MMGLRPAVFQTALRVSTNFSQMRKYFASNPQIFGVHSRYKYSQKNLNLPPMGTHPVNRLSQPPHPQLFNFWPQIGLYYTNAQHMKTLQNILNDILTTLTYPKAQMPALIPVRVVTKVQHTDRH
jgi:hypothetical protein